MLKSQSQSSLGALQFENLAPGTLAGGETHRRPGNIVEFGEHFDDRGVRPSVDRRCSHPDVQFFAALLRLRDAGPGVNSNPNLHDGW